MSPATAQRALEAHGLKPHLMDTFKLSADPAFEDKLVDVAGRCLNPPTKTAGLCMDELGRAEAR